MKTRYSAIFVAALCASLVGYSTSTAFGRGGRGGGGGFGGGGGGGGARISGGGGGMSRPSGGGMSRPSGGTAARPSGGLSAASRPSVGSSPSFNRPSGGASRPASPATRPSLGAGSGTRPSIQPGTRPNIGPGSGLAGGSRPSTLPATRPATGIGSGAGIGSRPSTLPATRPGTGAGIASRPATRPGAGLAAGVGIGAGIANRPGNTLPGLGSGNVGSRLPNQGAGVQDRMANRPQTLEDRRSSLNDRMTSGREDRQQNRGDMQDDRQEWRDNNREDWQNFAQENHGDWYNGSWDPGEGWNYMWDNYPGAATLGITRWGVNRLAYGFGYWGYSNPYYGGSYDTSSYSYSYAEPLVVYGDSGSSAAAVPTDPGVAPVESASAGPPQPTDEGMAAFEESRTAFYGGDYEKALSLLDTTLKTMPRDTVVHEFRGLVLFALKKYPESAAAIYAVLSAGPGWDWTTMSGLYPNVDVYTQQLRELENFTKSNPASADGNFLLGYNYLTTGYKDLAAKYFGIALQQLPGDKLLTQLAGTTSPSGEKQKTPPPAPPAPADLPPEKTLSVEKLVGTWNASSADAQFELQLAAEGTFVWSFSRGKTKESVKGVFAVDQNNLAMEPDAGGTMLAEVSLESPTKFNFKMVGGEPNDPGLQFTKN